jgi:hypothetical protein
MDFGHQQFLSCYFKFSQHVHVLTSDEVATQTEVLTHDRVRLYGPACEQFKVHFAGPGVLSVHLDDRYGSSRQLDVWAFSAHFDCHEGSATIFQCHKRLDVDVVRRWD